MKPPNKDLQEKILSSKRPDARTPWAPSISQTVGTLTISFPRLASLAACKAELPQGPRSQSTRFGLVSCLWSLVISRAFLRPCRHFQTKDPSGVDQATRSRSYQLPLMILSPATFSFMTNGGSVFVVSQGHPSFLSSSGEDRGHVSLSQDSLLLGHATRTSS
ncbi:hypothetical protein LIA77_01332 [Sarocladium implicatum]|jgi:hypothetical protein|nr:hypothetical protein LIA77_01332 [Sarocladium implicatum]